MNARTILIGRALVGGSLVAPTVTASDESFNINL